MNVLYTLIADPLCLGVAVAESKTSMMYEPCHFLQSRNVIERSASRKAVMLKKLTV